jgi:protein-L-isoaspartate(D-aspartate) O-methyltransferase
VVAAICEALALEGSEKVLDVGAGSGYSTAILARLAARVVGIELVESLAVSARRRLAELGIDNAEVRVADGTRGAPDQAPFDAIAVHATAPAPPPSLVAQLTPGGRLVVPIAAATADMLTAFVATPGGIEERVIAPCRFVPLLGVEGFGDG